MNDELRILADGYFDGYLEADQLRRLEEILQSDPVAKREFVKLAVLHGELGLVADEMCSAVDYGGVYTSAIGQTELQQSVSSERSNSVGWLRFLSLALAVSVLAAVTYSIWNHSGGETARVGYDLQQYPIRTVGYNFPAGRSGDAIPVPAGSIGSTDFTTHIPGTGGVEVNVSEGSRFGFASDTLGLLFEGKVMVSATDPNSQYAIEIGGQRILGHGSQFEIAKLDSNSALLKVQKGHVEIQSRVPGPRLAWSFEGIERDDLPISLRSGSSRVNGLIGRGALQFADNQATYAEIIGGTESTVGSGVFALSGGITIEAIVASNWNGEPQNNDIIFRKEDGPNRILLSFQNDDNEFEIPVVEPGPVLSFGVYLQGLGYSELDMPLDGRDGRPTVDQIADGKPHHIAASYDSFTGMKAIAVDGRICFSHQFPPGHCIQSGGPRSARIGGGWKRESFSGVIDELAIYDFALSPEQISKHHQLAQQGASWLSERPDPTQNWETVETVEEDESVWLGTHDQHPPDERKFFDKATVF